MSSSLCESAAKRSCLVLTLQKLSPAEVVKEFEEVSPILHDIESEKVLATQLIHNTDGVGI
jgi:hypothetical protein